MINNHCINNYYFTNKYASLHLFIDNINCMITIWNHHSSHKLVLEDCERYEAINEPNSKYIKYLEDCLSIFKNCMTIDLMNMNVYRHISVHLYVR